MPIYEYRCEHCNHELERLQRMSDDALKDCPECGEPALKKRISAPGFRLKGAGWYETDFKSGNKKNLAGDGSSKDKSSADKADSGKSGDSKKSNSSDKSSKGKADGKSSSQTGGKPSGKKAA